MGLNLGLNPGPDFDASRWVNGATDKVALDAKLGAGESQQRSYVVAIRPPQRIDILAPGRARIEKVDAAPGESLAAQTNNQQIGARAKEATVAVGQRVDLVLCRALVNA